MPKLKLLIRSAGDDEVTVSMAAAISDYSGCDNHTGLQCQCLDCPNGKHVTANLGDYPEFPLSSKSVSEKWMSVTESQTRKCTYQKERTVAGKESD